MIRVYYILYCAFTESYVYEERENCWQFTGQETAEQFDSLESTRKAKKRLEADGFPQLIILKMKQTNTIIKKIRNQEKKHVSA